MKKNAFCLSLLALFWAWSVPALWADPSLKQAEELFQAGRNAESLQVVASYLQAWPNEPRGMFLHGLILERMGRVAEAMAVYQNLIRSHPEFPEPYNNLAGLLAEQGRFEEAKDALQQALQTHPSYASAHQNLSRIYSAMASQAYRRVLGADDDHVQVKLEPLKELALLDGRTLLAVADSPGESTVMVAAAPVKRADADLSGEKDAGTQELPAPMPPFQPQDEEQLSPLPDPPKSSQPLPPEPSDLEEEMMSLLQEWAKAWARQDVPAYLSHYGSSFVPGDGLSLQAWREQRRVRVSTPSFIAIVLSDVTVNQTGQNTVLVRFGQHYRSNTIDNKVVKELLLSKEDGEWKIIREQVRSR